MITFEKSLVGLNWRFWVTLVGSTFPKALPCALLSFTVHICFYYGLTDGQLDLISIDHPYAVGALVVLVSFLVVYRAQSAYLRYSQAAEWFYHMDSKLTDACLQISNFHRQEDSVSEVRLINILSCSLLPFYVHAAQHQPSFLLRTRSFQTKRKQNPRANYITLVTSPLMTVPA